MPLTPIAVSAWRTSSSLSGLMIATTNFMVRPSLSGKSQTPATPRRVRASLPAFCANGTKSLQTQPKKQLLLRPGPIPGAPEPAAERPEFNSPPDPRTDASFALLAFADRAFLRDRGHQRAVGFENHAAGEAAPALRARRILGVEQPLVGAERPMKPHRMIEARRHHPLVEQRAAVTRHDGIEQREIRRIGQGAHMQRRIVGQFGRGANPDMDAAVVDFLAKITAEFDRAQFDRAVGFVIAADEVRH